VVLTTLTGLLELCIYLFVFYPKYFYLNIKKISDARSTVSFTKYNLLDESNNYQQTIKCEYGFKHLFTFQGSPINMFECKINNLGYFLVLYKFNVHTNQKEVKVNA